jgi:hypothetical protein
MQPLNEGTIMVVLEVLLAITGFLSVFLLNAIWKSQEEATRALALVMSRLESHEVRITHCEGIVDRVERCRDCPSGGER